MSIWRRMLSSRVGVHVALSVVLALAIQTASASQKLSLATAGGATSGSIKQGTGTFQLDLTLSTDHSVSTLEYYIDAGGASVKYGSPVLTILGAPNLFTSADLAEIPVAGTPVAIGDVFEGVTGWIQHGTLATDEYPAFTAPVARYTFDVSQLTAQANPYLLTPVFVSYYAADLNFEPTFDAPGAFALTVIAPEPASLGFACMAVIASATLRRKRKISV